jgi:hypothetical protein
MWGLGALRRLFGRGGVAPAMISGVEAIGGETPAAVYDRAA